MKDYPDEIFRKLQAQHEAEYDRREAIEKWAETNSALMASPETNKLDEWQAEAWVVDGFATYPPLVDAASGILPPYLPFSADAAVSSISGASTSEASIADAFENHIGGAARYCDQRSKWYIWNGIRWRPHSRAVVRAYMAEIARLMSGGAPKFSCASAASGAENIASWRSTAKQAQEGWKWDADPYLLGTPRWTVSLKYGSILYTPHPGMGITRSTSVAPCDRACPLWRAFLTDATGGDVDMQEYLKRVAGYMLTGDTSEHALFFLHGPGGNGKSVFTNVILEIMGEYGGQSPMDTFTASSGERHPTELAALDGRRLVVASETEEGRHFAEARIKMLTGGEPITARHMRQDFYTFIPQFKLLLTGNYQPNLRDVGDAMRRRVHMIPFLHKPKEVNKALQVELRAEHDAILWWMIQGARDWVVYGLDRPEIVRASTERYFTDQDVFRQWLEDCCAVDRSDDEGGAEPATLFASWKAYAEKSGEKPGTQKRFAAAMGRQGLHSVRRYRSEDKATRVFYPGVSLRPAPLMRERSETSEASEATSGLGATRAHEAGAHAHAHARESDDWKCVSDASDVSEEQRWWPDDD